MVLKLQLTLKYAKIFLIHQIINTLLLSHLYFYNFEIHKVQSAELMQNVNIISISRFFHLTPAPALRSIHNSECIIAEDAHFYKIHYIYNTLPYNHL